EVVTHRHGAHSLPPTAFDDVALGIRGLDEIAVVPGQINVLWVISQPDLVTARELADFDLVYAASPAWAKQMSERAGREVGVLLQATDLSLRADMTKPVGDGSRPVFVGGAPRDRVRPVVAAAIAAGVDVDVHGPFWDNKIPAANWSGTYVDNHELMQLYRDHGLVLADHHQDMREHGFLANRLFDAVASGARVVSDSVDGVELFGGAVQSFHDQDDLALLCSEAGRSRFPDDSEMTRIADRIAAEHSFDARAATLLADVSRVWSERKG
uniref:glycosyltransferase family protein n=1 Tax=Nocardioides sp. TaxID=35761 RepID=UPI003569BFDB